MPIERLRLSHLSAGERADLESALDTLESRFFESRRLISAMLVCAAAWLLLAEVMLLDELRDSSREGGPLRFFEGFVSGLPYSLLFLTEPEVLLLAATVALPMVIVALVVHAWHQDEEVHALTSFGLVRMRRKSLRLLRYADVAEARLGRGWSLARCETTDMLEVFDKEGKRLVLHAYRKGLEDWKARIDSRRNPTDTDRKRTA